MKKSAIKKFPGVRKKGSGKFVIDYIDHNNIRHQITFNGTEQDAIRVKKAFTIKRDRIKMGIELPPEKLIDVPSLSKLWTEFEQDKKLKIAGGSMRKISLDRYEDVKIAVKKYSKKLMKTSIDKINSVDIEMFKIFRRNNTVSDACINTELRHLKSVFNFAIKKTYIQISPMIDVPNVKTISKDVRYLNEEELANLNDVLSKLDLTIEYQKDAHDLVLFYLCTGARATEGLFPELRWDSINNNSINFIMTKNRKARNIPIVNDVKRVLDSRRHLAGGPFDFSYNKMYRRVKYVAHIAGLYDLSPQILRRTAGAYYCMATRNIFATSRWMGHASVKVTESHYIGLLQSMEVENSDAFEKLLARTMSKSKSPQ